MTHGTLGYGAFSYISHDEVANDSHAGTVASKLLVGHLRIVLLRLYELVVEVQVV